LGQGWVKLGLRCIGFGLAWVGLDKIHRNSTVIATILSDLTRSDNCKMAAANPEVSYFVCVWFERMTNSDNPVQISRIGQTTHNILHVVRFGIVTLCKSRVITTYVIMAFISNSDFRCGVAMLGVVPLNYPTPKTWYYDLKSRC